MGTYVRKLKLTSWLLELGEPGDGDFANCVTDSRKTSPLGCGSGDIDPKMFIRLFFLFTVLTSVMKAVPRSSLPEALTLDGLRAGVI